MDKTEEYMDKALEEGKDELNELQHKAREKLKEKKDKKVVMTERIKAQLIYFGIWSAVIAGVSYVLAVVAMVVGFESALTLEGRLTFAILSAIIGLLINFLLGQQGITFAKKEPESQTVIKAYNLALNKTKSLKQLKVIGYYVALTTVIDVFVKGLTTVLSLYFTIEVFSQGNGQFVLILLAIGNLGLFTAFGLKRMSALYDKFIDQHLGVLKTRTEKLNEEAKEKEKENERN